MKILLLSALLSSVSPLIAVKASESFQADAEQIRKQMREVCCKERQEGKSIEELYQVGLTYRDGKAGGYAQGSWWAREWAKAYFHEAAMHNHLKAMHNLGSIFYKVNDYKTAALWFQRAANLNFAPSQRNLARMVNDNLIDLATVYVAEKHRPYPSPTLLKPNRTAFEAYPLPVELHMHIASYLSIQELGNLSQVNRQWRSICSELINRISFIDKMDHMQEKIGSTTYILGTIASAFIYLQQSIRLMVKDNSNYFSDFIKFAAAELKGKEVKISGLEAPLQANLQ